MHAWAWWPFLREPILAITLLEKIFLGEYADVCRLQTSTGYRIRRLTYFRPDSGLPSQDIE